MHRVVAFVSLILLSGCGSCLEDKGVPEVKQEPTSPGQVYRVRTDAGVRAIAVGQGPDFSTVLDGSSNANSP